MRIRTKRWNDPVQANDGLRVLVCRYRPRGVREDSEPWHVWRKELGPSEALHAAYYGKSGPPIDFKTYRERYLAEMAGQQELIDALARRALEGEALTLLCSSACEDPFRCHRTLLRELIEKAAERLKPG